MLPEDVLVSAIARAVGEPSGGVVLGIGDDAAVLDDGTVVSTDILVEGVHFDLARTTPRDVGHRAATANLSDLAGCRASEVEVDALDQDVGRDHGAVVEHGGVVADPEDDVAGRLSDGGGDRRDQRLLW